MKNEDLYRGTIEPEHNTPSKRNREQTLCEILNCLILVADKMVEASGKFDSIALNQKTIADNQRLTTNAIINLQHRVSEVLEEVRNG